MSRGGFANEISLFMERGIAHLVGGPFAAPVFMFAMDKVGDFEVRLIGKGDFNGKAKKIFRIVLDEDEAAQAV